MTITKKSFFTSLSPLQRASSIAALQAWLADLLPKHPENGLIELARVLLVPSVDNANRCLNAGAA
jgi:hypothetical protein